MVIVYFVSASTAFPHSSYRIPISDPIYRVLDQLLAFDLSDVPLYGIRPWSAEEIDRSLTDAEHRSQEKLKIFSVRSFSEAERELGIRIRIRELWKEVEAYRSRWGRAQERPTYEIDFLKTLAADVGTGDTASHPFSSYREARPLVPGAQYHWQSEHGFHIARSITGYARPFFEARFPDDDATGHTLSWHEAYGRAVGRNAAIQVGRSALQLGQGVHGGFLASDHMRALDGVQITNDLPIELPVIGRSKGIVTFAILEPDDRERFWSGAKVAVQPFCGLELGVGYAAVIDTAESGGETANELTQMDLRVTSKVMRGSEWYLETAWDDAHAKSAAFLLGLYLPRFSDSGILDFRVEMTHIGTEFGRAVALGDPLGRRSSEMDIAVGYAVNHAIRFENRLNIVRDDRNQSNEWAVAWRPRLTAEVTANSSFSVSAGYERILTDADDRDSNQFVLITGFQLVFPSLGIDG